MPNGTLTLNSGEKGRAAGCEAQMAESRARVPGCLLGSVHQLCALGLSTLNLCVLVSSPVKWEDHSTCLPPPLRKVA